MDSGINNAPAAPDPQPPPWKRPVTAIVIFGLPLLLVLADMLMTGRGALTIPLWVLRSVGLYFVLVVAMFGWSLYAHGVRWLKQPCWQGIRALWSWWKSPDRKFLRRSARRLAAPRRRNRGAVLTAGEKVMVVFVSVVSLAHAAGIVWTIREMLGRVVIAFLPPTLRTWGIPLIGGFVFTGVELWFGFIERDRPARTRKATQPAFRWSILGTALCSAFEVAFVIARGYMLHVGEASGADVWATNLLFFALASIVPWMNRWLGSLLPRWIGDAGGRALGTFGRVLRVAGIAIGVLVLAAIGLKLVGIAIILLIPAGLYFGLEYVVRILCGRRGFGEPPLPPSPPPSDGGEPLGRTRDGSSNGGASDRSREPVRPRDPAVLALLTLAFASAIGGCVGSGGSEEVPSIRSTDATSGTGARNDERFALPECVGKLQLGTEYAQLAPTEEQPERTPEQWWICGVDISCSNREFALLQLAACIATARSLPPETGVWIAFTTGTSDATSTRDLLPIAPVLRRRWRAPPLPCDPHCEPESVRERACLNAVQSALASTTDERERAAAHVLVGAQRDRNATIDGWFRTDIEPDLTRHLAVSCDRQRRIEERRQAQIPWIPDGSSFLKFWEKVRGFLAEREALHRTTVQATVVLSGDLWEQIGNTDDRLVSVWATRDSCNPKPLLSLPSGVTAFLYQTLSTRRDLTEWGKAWVHLLRCAGATLPGQDDGPFRYARGMTRFPMGLPIPPPPATAQR